MIKERGLKLEVTDSTDSRIDEDDEYYDSLTGVESFGETLIDGRDPIDLMTKNNTRHC